MNIHSLCHLTSAISIALMEENVEETQPTGLPAYRISANFPAVFFHPEGHGQFFSGIAAAMMLQRIFNEHRGKFPEALMMELHLNLADKIEEFQLQLEALSIRAYDDNRPDTNVSIMLDLIQTSNGARVVYFNAIPTCFGYQPIKTCLGVSFSS